MIGSIESLYKFKKDDAYRFAEFVGIQVREGNNNLHFKTCPYCRPKNTRENVNTFAIDLEYGRFTCLRAKCGVSGNMLTLAKDFNFSLGNDIDRVLFGGKRYRTFKTPDKPIVSSNKAEAYLKGRGITADVVKRYEITTRDDNDKVLVFPFFDEKGILRYIKYRRTDFDKTKHNSKEWSERDCMPILFGMKQCNPENKTLIICEGQIDSLSVASAGIENAVSVPNGKNAFTWKPHVWNWICGFETIIVFGDYENDEISLLKEINQSFGCAIKHVNPKDYMGHKDANEILVNEGKEQIIKCIENAVNIPVKRVIPLSQVKSVDIYKMKKIPTGIADEDRLLYGGLPLGFVHIIAGKRGDGKSTLASQIIVKAIESGYKCFVYSGELLEGNFKAWMNFQIAGSKNIIENQNYGSSPYRFITNSNQEMIDDWLDGKCFIYDSLSQSNEDENLIATTEEMIRRYDVKVILIDNLMTAIHLDRDSERDKFERQGKFVRKLSRLAIAYDVAILLVAHMRKGTMSDDVNDEISGSADITNLAGVVLSYNRFSEKEIAEGVASFADRKLITSKNRLFGKLNMRGIKLSFDEKSLRIYGEHDDVNHDYGWKKEVFEYGDNPFT